MVRRHERTDQAWAQLLEDATIVRVHQHAAGPKGDPAATWGLPT